MKFYLISLGCAKNLVDSEKLTGYLLNAGYVITDDIDKASLVIINTCGFIKDAKKESIDTILTILREKPVNTKTVVYGCLVQRYQKDLEKLIPEVDLFLPLLPYKELAEKIIQKFPPYKWGKTEIPKKILFTPPSYTYIKISDGCNNFCSYCTIPLIRGRLKSLPVEDIVIQIRKAIAGGFYEINLIAQDITAYGTDLYGKPSLEFLLKRILSIKKDFWLRLLYLYPSRISEELINIMHSDSRIVKYIDIPIQHVNNRILRLMRRHYTKEILLEKISLFKEKIPSLAIRTTFIAGFPSESGKELNELQKFIEHIQFDHLGVFEYSPEEDTPAFSLKPRLPFNIKRKRKKLLMEAQKKVVRIKNRSLVGKTFSCLIEQPADRDGSVWIGRIYSQAPEVDGVVYVTGYNENMGKIIDVRIKNFKDYDLAGECVR
ncbi:MAG: 30S ribosomal protein S12 methylthiotransferase RimO [Nitrospirota bacterium]